MLYTALLFFISIDILVRSKCKLEILKHTKNTKTNSSACLFPIYFDVTHSFLQFSGYAMWRPLCNALVKRFFNSSVCFLYAYITIILSKWVWKMVNVNIYIMTAITIASNEFYSCKVPLNSANSKSQSFHWWRFSGRWEVGGQGVGRFRLSRGKEGD